MPSYSGKVVTPETALQVAAVWCCVKILAETEAQLPLGVYRRENGTVMPATDHQNYELLHNSPNPEMSAMDFRMSQTAQLALWGNCYSRIARNGKGQVIGLWPLQSKLMAVKRDSRGELAYQYSAGGSYESYNSSDILHVRTLSFDGINGISPVAQLNNPVGLSMALEEFAGRYFGNGAIPAIALEHPARLGPEAVRNIKESWKSMYGGNQHAHETAVLEEGMKIQVLGTDPQKSQSVESRKFQIGEIARAYRMPLHMIGDLDRATFSNIEQQSLEFVVYTLMPWLELWEQAVNRTLFTPAERKTYFCEHNVAGLLRGDIQSRYHAYATGRQWGWLTINDILRLENMNPIGEDGDTRLSPLNMVAVGSTSETNPSTANVFDEESDKAKALKSAILAVSGISRNGN